jgi:hypothetical protein
MIAPPLWVAELAEVFWQVAGGPGPFPPARCGGRFYSPRLT